MAVHDVIIIGSGLAGLTAGLFSARQGLSTLVFESNIPGGHLISIEKIEDFPGFPDGVSGYEICPNLQRQASDHGAEFQRAEVSRLEAQDKLWSVVTEEESFQAKAVIVATGSTLKHLGVPGEEKLMGRGVSHRGLSIHQGDFSLVCCLKNSIKKQRSIIRHSRIRENPGEGGSRPAPTSNRIHSRDKGNSDPSSTWIPFFNGMTDTTQCFFDSGLWSAEKFYE